MGTTDEFPTTDQIITEWQELRAANKRLREAARDVIESTDCMPAAEGGRGEAEGGLRRDGGRAMTAPPTSRLILPYEAPNLNDLIRMKAASAYVRGQKSSAKHGKPGRSFDSYTSLKQEWAERVKLHVLEQRVATFPNGAHLSFEIHEKARNRDPDNIVSGAHKLIIDGLVKCGVLPGDGWKGALSLSDCWLVSERPAVIVTLIGPGGGTASHAGAKVPKSRKKAL